MKQLVIAFFLFTATCFASSLQKPLIADQAFRFSATAKDEQTILLMWQIAPNYYLYRTHFDFQAIQPKNAVLGEPIYPETTQSIKTTLGTYTVYQHELTIPIPIVHNSEKNIVLQIRYQGCSQFGFCYPPMSKVVSINLSDNNGQPVSGLDIDVAPMETTTQNTMDSLLDHHSLWLITAGFFIFGLLLSFTPCILPMIPILSSIIIGEHKKQKITHVYSFFLSLFYVLGMAMTYAIAGILFGFLGASVQTFFQQTWVIILFSLLFVAMALSLFGIYQIQLPEKLRAKIVVASQHQKHGTYFGALVMGVLSTLILSPCVTPPLVAVLSYIGQTGNAWFGGSALFSMGIGMGIPLLLLGALGPKVLPHADPWINRVNNFMGILLLAVAIFMIERVLSGWISMLLWAGLCVGIAIYLGALSTAKTYWTIAQKGIGLCFFMYGVLLIVSAYHGNTNPLNVLQKSAQKHTLRFKKITSIADAENIIRTGKPVLLDFYADWCIACQELDATTFANHDVQKALKNIALLRVDVTNNTLNDRLIAQHFDVIAPPTIVFFKNEREITNARIVGFVDAKTFLRRIDIAKNEYGLITN